MTPLRGAYTALVTPLQPHREIDWERFDALLEFQRSAQIDGVVIGGTTAESPTFRRGELEALVARALDRLPGSMTVIAGTGRNDVREASELTARVADLGVRHVMLVDPAYNAPSSVEIRREYLVPLAQSFPELQFLSYVIPARTGTCLLPEDLLQAYRDAPNLAAVKDATGQPDYSRRVRTLLPPPFSLLSGDDNRALAMIHDPEVRADGIVSVSANLAPHAIQRAVHAALDGNRALADSLAPTLLSLGNMVSFPVREETTHGPVDLKVRNPLPTKAAFAMLGAGIGPCRPPLGRLTPAGFDWLARHLEDVERTGPGVFEPLRTQLGSHGSAASADELRQSWSYERY
ncbi:MAG: dihydrodipicolinate synthase family protein [Thermoplasmata archaeon]|nr:dihydrodipicolinate synthase family protein [Thermoplasmata archaeon]